MEGNSLTSTSGYRILNATSTTQRLSMRLARGEAE